MFLFQFERREAGFVITSYNSTATPDGKSRFCVGLQFNSRQDAKEYVEGVAGIERDREAMIRKTDSISKRWAAEGETKKRMDELERKFAGKCRKVVFDIPFAGGPVDKGKVYTPKEVSNIEYYHGGIGAKDGRLPSRVA